MSAITFDDSRFEAECGGIRLELLAKEYALLRFLYTHANLVFSREQLLDRVWPGEYPVDRTVDDHVYRLRKKLKAARGPKIETIRGVGYCLTLRPEAGGAAPSLRDPSVQEAMNGVFARYHRIGQGRAMLSLAEQRQQLGFELNAFYRLYIHFIKGDLGWFLDKEEAPMSERIYWLLLFDMFADTPQPKASLCERALRLNALHAEGHREMEILNIADLYAAEGRIEEAAATIERGRRAAAEQELEGFVVPIEISALYVSLLADDPSAAAEQSAKVAELLKAEPYLRELAGYRMLEGARMILTGREAEGSALLDEGLETFEQSGFVPHRLLSLLRTCGVLRRRMPGSEAERRCCCRLASEYANFGPAEHWPRLESTIEQYLNELERTKT
ncbi:winged helix-turn-helix domain-containing protein [Saccharibacillus alkalitolerans]|uniref:Winged helix-turn-helix transcriptional regulator n=1 Tax=Saccharibacillus alkalitolerans TaxID=2705290 RepID=A0ABX0F9M1_9BACL|nr:winged helix-turn-helix domain-containing protein [Saccharibacillus alkalitolerans]NGZ76263.1 winged helix-turn-helix transcriptional regulator [Saccharibacillus alkalitolerans]